VNKKLFLIVGAAGTAGVAGVAYLKRDTLRLYGMLGKALVIDPLIVRYGPELFKDFLNRRNDEDDFAAWEDNEFGESTDEEDVPFDLDQELRRYSEFEEGEHAEPAQALRSASYANPWQFEEGEQAEQTQALSLPLKDAFERVLDSREQQVIQLRFGLYGETRSTLEEIGQRLGVTREQARQIEVEALHKLTEDPLLRDLDQELRRYSEFEEDEQAESAQPLSRDQEPRVVEVELEVEPGEKAKSPSDLSPARYPDRVPMHRWRARARIDKFRDDFYHGGANRLPTIAEIAAFTGDSPEKVAEILRDTEGKTRPSGS
jgi:RNA polymerase sigma factor (sigma-70 family)